MVGLGFGAFEASGYTLTYGLHNGEISLHSMISEELLREVIAPFCHGIWTGLLGAAIFAAKAAPDMERRGDLPRRVTASRALGLVVERRGRPDGTFRMDAR